MRLPCAIPVLLALVATLFGEQRSPAVPAGPLYFGVFTATFAPDGAFTLEGAGWPAFRGTWKADGPAIAILTPDVKTPGCDGPGRYTLAHVAAGDVRFQLVEDACTLRRTILDGGTWRSTSGPVPPGERRFTRSAAPDPPPLPPVRPDSHSWPSFRGSNAAGVTSGMRLPDRWDGARGEHILWRTPIPGLAHSSPVVWGDRLFVTTAISSKPDATFRPGLYGDGDASEDRTPHRWMIYAIDKMTGEVLWERVAHEGTPVEKRHIKSTYASSTPATDGRIVVAWFGSQGVHAYDVNGAFLWKVDVGHVNMGAYDIPTYEWGPASSPIIWNDLVILQVDTQTDSFLVALDAATGETVWRTPRDELPSWGTPTVAETPDGPQLVTNASNFIRGYDPRTGEELWRLGGSSKITAPTPIFADGLWVVASGRAPERPLFAVRPSARGDITLPVGQTSSDAVAWSRTGRGAYMPTPLVYDGVLYVLNNNGVFDAYDVRTGDEVYRQRIEHVGNGFSASPVAADGRLYLSNEDGDIIVIAAGREFRQLAINPMGELLMATPALSDGVLYVRTWKSLFAIGARQSVSSLPRFGSVGSRLSADDIASLDQLFAEMDRKPWVLVVTEAFMPPPTWWTVDAYLEPEIRTARLRRGPIVYVKGEIDAGSDTRVWRAHDQHASWAQVAAQGRSLDEPVAERDIQRPFRVIGNAADDDIVSLVDFVRSSPEHVDSSRASGDPVPPVFSRVAGDWPIDRIEWRSDQTMDVSLLKHTYQGQLVTLRRTESGWAIERISYWVSG